MKRILVFSLIISFLSISYTLNAQTKDVVTKKKKANLIENLTPKKLTNRIEVGYNNPSRFGSGVSSTYFNGVKMGVTTELEMKYNISLLTGVLYNLVYSDKVQRYPNSTSINSLTYGHFINVPLMAIYNIPINKNLKLFGYGGPTFSIGLRQREVALSTVSTIPSAYTDMYNSSLNRLNLQVGLGGGVQWKKFQLKGGYDWGVLNLNKTDTGKLYQRGWYITFGCEF